MAMYRINPKTKQSFWVSALLNRGIVNTLMIDRKRNSQSMSNLMQRLAQNYGLPTKTMSFLPIYNPTDSTQWPELLGWLLTFADHELVEE